MASTQRQMTPRVLGRKYWSFYSCAAPYFLTLDIFCYLSFTICPEWTKHVRAVTLDRWASHLLRCWLSPYHLFTEDWKAYFTQHTGCKCNSSGLFRGVRIWPRGNSYFCLLKCKAHSCLPWRYPKELDNAQSSTLTHYFHVLKVQSVMLCCL